MATVPDTWEVQKVEGLQAPIKGVTVYPRKAEITRVFTFSPDAKGLHEVSSEPTCGLVLNFVLTGRTQGCVLNTA